MAAGCQATMSAPSFSSHVLCQLQQRHNVTSLPSLPAMAELVAWGGSTWHWCKDRSISASSIPRPADDSVRHRLHHPIRGRLSSSATSSRLWMPNRRRRSAVDTVRRQNSRACPSLYRQESQTNDNDDGRYRDRRSRRSRCLDTVVIGERLMPRRSGVRRCQNSASCKERTVYDCHVAELGRVAATMAPRRSASCASSSTDLLLACRRGSCRRCGDGHHSPSRGGAGKFGHVDPTDTSVPKSGTSMTTEPTFAFAGLGSQAWSAHCWSSTYKNANAMLAWRPGSELAERCRSSLTSRGLQCERWGLGHAKMRRSKITIAALHSTTARPIDEEDDDSSATAVAELIAGTAARPASLFASLLAWVDAYVRFTRPHTVIGTEAEEDVLTRRTMEDEQRMAWKLAMMREKKRRVEAANATIQELEEVRKLRLQLTPQVALERKVEIIAQSVERLAKVQEKHYEFSRSQEISVRSMRTGLRDFARELVGAVGTEVSHRLEKTVRFCVGAIEGVKVAAPKEEETRPRREPVKVKFPDSYNGKREENFDNWEANVRTYVHLQQVSPDQQVLIAIHTLKDEAASFARSLVRAANCSDDPVAYSIFTPLVEFLKLLRERFADVARSVKASDRLQTIHARKWKSAKALKSTMDELVAVPDHGVTDTQLVGLFYRAIPEALRGHFFAKSEDPATTYDSLSREVVAFEAKSASVSTFWHKDLDKGKQWKGRTISGQVKTKDSLVLTLDEGSVDEIPYDQIEWGLEEEDSGVGQGKTYAAVAAGGRPQGGRGQGQVGRALGSRSQGDQGVGGRGGNRQVGGRGQGPPQNRPRNRSPYRVGGWHPWLPQGVAEELKERRPAWAKMKKENKGQLILLDVEIFKGRVGALVDSGATRSYISKKVLQKLKLGLKVQKLADPIVSILADNRTMVVEEYVEGVQTYFRLEKDGKVEKVLHSLTLLVEDTLPFDIVLGMDWGEAAGATLHLKEHECRLPSSSAEAKTAHLFHVSGVENSLAHCYLSAPAFARLVKKEKLEEQVFVAYVRPVTEPTEERPMDPAIAKLLEEFKDLTEPPSGTVPQPIQHRIEIEPGTRTPKGAMYRMSPRELEELRKQLDELLEKGWIRPSSSPFGAPVLFVPKKEGELRMCIDYRGLNAIIVKNAEPLPRIDDLLDRVQGAKYFSKIDLKSGYHQIEVHPDDQYKTSFRTRYGHYEFIVMPFGLTNGPATFQRCMNDLFRPWLDRFVVVYLDDILVFNRTLEEHQGHLRQVLEKLREANFKINAKKCDWAKTQVLYLGHVLDGDGVKREDSKIAAIRDWPTPCTLTELRSFLGLANYYRKFVRNFSTIAAPLRGLLRKETIWKWDKDCTSAMKKLKQALIEYPILKVADPSLPFVVTTDASQYDIGAVL
ncbi:hypothetical protein CBR_g50228 [Chara braunii]|uniref:Reverse transcriptase domain-containing protein n=1 Tax=Chara braunii TaxID=69332 RepID=A0A388M6C4_CHABU|nr:hypothetical protein CBR_g50228 [Chara braunii]|eukprot:GBG90134.1 hypothetical protein CBR_g50228 [Chara braunii]